MFQIDFIHLLPSFCLVFDLLLESHFSLTIFSRVILFDLIVYLCKWILFESGRRGAGGYSQEYLQVMSSLLYQL